MRYQHNIIERVLFIYHYHNSSIFNSNSIPDRIVSLSVGSYFIFINIALAMLRRDKPLTDKINDIIAQELPADQRNKGRIASLAPYLAEIERRKKMRSIRERSKKNLNESSSKSFRIKEKSVTSLQKELFNHTRDVSSNNNVSRRNEDKVHRERKTKSVQRQHQMKFSKTIQSKPTLSHKVNSDFFNDLYARIKGKIQRQREKGKEKVNETDKQKDISKAKEKEKALRRKQFETFEQHRARSQQAGELNMYKISCTNVANVNCDSKREPSIDLKKKTQNMPVKKGNFRRNKYEALHSSVTTNNMEASNINRQQLQHQSDSRIILDKKQSNATINMEMDKLAEREMSTFYQQVVNKEMHRSIEKSTEKYFNYESYRPTKSKHDIEIYLSTFTNPSLQKVSKSTNQKSQKNKDKLFSSLNQQGEAQSNELLNYDFDFKNDQSDCSKINEINDAQLEQSTFNLKNEKDDFQKQRKQVEIDHFTKPAPQLDWSEDDCKVDEI